MASVHIHQLQLQRKGFRLGPLDIDVPHGGRLAVVGPSGAGKTTLLRCLAGFDRADSGTIRIDAAEVFGGRTNLAPDRRGIGVVFQDGSLWPHLTALQHLRFAAPQLDRAAAAALLERAGIAALADRKPASMSGGEAQRLGLVRALAAAPKVLLLDEPLRSVDVHRRDELVLLLRTFADERDLTTILVTHDRDEALALATDLVVLRDGRAVEQGPATELLQRPRTAFTAAFLAGAACMPTTPAGPGRVATAFGEMACADTTAPPRLVLMPGDVQATAHDATHADGAPIGRVLSAQPNGTGVSVRIALGEQIVPAIAEQVLPAGSAARLTLRRQPRLLPWDDGATT